MKRREREEAICELYCPNYKLLNRFSKMRNIYEVKKEKQGKKTL